MKRQIRRGVFETNSSSVHSLTMCTQSDYDRWKNGELIYDYWKDKLISLDDTDHMMMTYIIHIIVLISMEYLIMKLLKIHLRQKMVIQ